jgi:hypothetical protein
MFRFAIYHSKTKDYSLHILDRKNRILVPEHNYKNIWIIIKDKNKHGILEKTLVNIPWSVYVNSCSEKSRKFIDNAEKYQILNHNYNPNIEYYRPITPVTSIWS